MPHTIVIFGASGDLTSRKLIPALYLLSKKGRLPKETRIVGMARSKFSHEAWRGDLEETTRKFTNSEFDATAWNSFANNVFYHAGDLSSADDLTSLNKFLGEI